MQILPLVALLVQGPVAASTPPASPPPPAAPRRQKRGDKSAPAKPLQNPGRWVTNDDYPTRATRESREGTTEFTLDIGPDGVPTGCVVTISSGHEDLDAQTCRLIRTRARFSPATDRKGKAVAGHYSNRVRWQIPEEVVWPNPFVDGSNRISFTIGVDGRPTDCSVQQKFSAPVPSGSPCDDPDLRFEPFRDADGKAVARRVWITNLVRVGPVLADDQTVTDAAPQDQ